MSGTGEPDAAQAMTSIPGPDTAAVPTVDEPGPPVGEPASAAPASPAGATGGSYFPDAIEEAMDRLASDFGIKSTQDDLTIRLIEPVKGSPHLAVLQSVGLARKAPRVGAAAHGPAGVAAAVWERPNLYISRWTGASRWVTAYKLPPTARPDDYLRDEGGIPSRFGTGSWYKEVPDEVGEAFLAVGMLLDEAPFPVPAVAPSVRKPVKAAAAPRARTTSTSTSTPRAAAEPRVRARKEPAPAPLKKPLPPTARTCPMCNLQKQLSQFVAGSEYCVDCR